MGPLNPPGTFVGISKAFRRDGEAEGRDQIGA